MIIKLFKFTYILQLESWTLNSANPISFRPITVFRHPSSRFLLSHRLNLSVLHKLRLHSRYDIGIMDRGAAPGFTLVTINPVNDKAEYRLALAG